MASTTVSLERFRTGDLPEVCAKTGEPADLSWGTTLTHIPRWAWVLLPFGILPFLVASRIASKRVDGLIPLSERASVRIAQTTRLRMIGLLVGGALLFIGFVLDSQQATWAGIGGIAIASLATLVGVWWFVGGTWDPKAETATLRRVHPAFVEATAQK